MSIYQKGGSFMDDIDLTQFELFEPTPRQTSAPALSITSRGEIRFNEKLLQEFPSRKFALLLSKDGNEFLLDANREPAIHLTANGVRKDIGLSQQLVRLGVNLPARYQFSWNEKHSVWHGRCVSQNLPVPDPLTLRNINSRKPRKGGTK